MRSWVIFFSSLIGVFILDQALKELFLMGFSWQSKCISLELHLNKGVAFSMLSFLGEWLKYLQLAILLFLIYFVLKERWIEKYPLSIGFIGGGALGNLYDRFFHGAVTDYVFWHCGFNFAVFNLADVMIDIGIGLILLQELFKKKV